LFWFTEYHSSQANQQEAVDSLTRDSVPIIIARGDKKFSSNFRQIDDYIKTNYRLAQESRFGGNSDSTYQVLVNKQLAPSGTYRMASLPCYR
jgi:hypothetical protein